ncbi:MAG: Peptidase [Verrucomicrobiales bacterium]|nr:Peptidase [Verrucomicrobiales bacterium]
MNGEVSAPRHHNVWWQILLAFILLLPVVLLLTIPRFRTSNEMMVLIVLILIANIVLLWLATRRRPTASPNAVPPILPHELTAEEIPPTIHEILDVKQAAVDDDLMIFRGTLRENSELAFGKLKHEYAGRGTPLLQQDPTYGHAIFLTSQIPQPVMEERADRFWLNWLLFGLTLLTTTAAGAIQQGADIFHQPASLAIGLPYSIAIMAILGFHELGHYYTARHYRISVTPPFFIPVPFALGTFGAFIKMRSAPEERRSLFDVAIAGPFAGLALAIPALIIGLRGSTVVPTSAETDQVLGGLVSSSILFMSLAKAVLGDQLAQGNLLQLTPLAFAGWLGLLVTALNLLPIGQLDGGHIARGMFGTRVGGWISQIAMFSLFIGALFQPQFLFWALIVFFIARRVSPPLNDVTPIKASRMWLGALAFLILALIIVPMPEVLWDYLNQNADPQTLTI